MDSNNLRQNIAILHLLCKIPTAPSSSQPSDQISSSDGRYILSFDEEKKLCHSLAFISGSKVGSESISAVCIWQNKTYLDVLVAVNRNSSEDGRNVISVMGKGFDRIFEVMSQQPQGKIILKDVFILLSDND